MELRDLPSVGDLMATVTSHGLAREITSDVARHAIDRARQQIQEGGTPDAGSLAQHELDRLARLRPQRVINAGGVLLNTNLGRAPIHADAAAAAATALQSYGNVEFDLATGRRGGRGAYVNQIITSLTGAEAALVVNNNAGALFLTLAALGTGRQVVISRGELIEIGGSFRLPELMAAAGVWLVEVGTTNRTRPGDYEDAITPQTGMLLKVHPSNYRLVGFTEEAGYDDLARLAGRHRVPFVADIGSGLLDDQVPWVPGPPPAWLAGEPAARQVLAASADIVLFSGDKLLGGPQAGIIAGSQSLIDRIGRHPIARAVRCDGATLAALTATLELYADGRGGEVPFWAMVGLSPAGLADRCRAVLERSGVSGYIVDDESVVGAGSVPGQTIPSPVIRLPNAGTAWEGLLAREPSIVARRAEGDLIVDLRAVDPDDDAVLAAGLSATCRS
ncbi:MAG: L-seryl-tRNA(Sec) selenium transferase [Acidimicrobiia bacterium]|nr:L-seryl-tRNA(Sec) selenium transferase [Acidimicrobiia bacterium]